MHPEQRVEPLEICMVEDDDDLREEIVESLQESGFRVRGFPGSRELYASLLRTPCDIVLLDVGLPGEDGFAIAGRLREMGPVGIIMLTARAQSDDRVRGLQQGADAYLVKPTDLRVLEATILSLARRLKKDGGDDAAMPQAPAVPTEKSWALSADGWTLLDPSGGALQLSTQERIFLRCLLERAGTAVPRETLVAALSTDPDGYNLHRLDAMVNRLRKKSTEQGMHLPLRAVRGVGYLFAAR